jgi:hypothetical protein
MFAKPKLTIASSFPATAVSHEYVSSFALGTLSMDGNSDSTGVGITKAANPKINLN